MSSATWRIISNLPPKSQKTWQNLKESLATSISNSCTSLNDLHCLHAQSITSGLHQNLYIASHLITRYFGFQEPSHAQKVFAGLTRPVNKTLVWNSLIKGYLRSGLPESAISVYDEMIQDSSECDPDKQTFHLALMACTHLSEPELGFKIEEDVKRRGLQSDLLIATALISLYSKAGDVERAARVFDGMPVRDVIAWNAMLSAYSQAGHISDAMGMYKRMRSVDGMLPTEASLVSLVSCCGDGGLFRSGEAVHAHVIKAGVGANLNVLNSLMAMYVACDCLDTADKVFSGMIVKDAISWSTIIGGYVENERPHDALSLFQNLVSSNAILPTRPILLNALLACADLGDYSVCSWIKEKYLVNENGELIQDACLVTGLLYMYAKCGEMQVALELLNEVTWVRQDVVAWNAIMKACMEKNQENWVPKITLMMQRRGVNSNAVTFLMLLTTVSLVPLPRKGMETHCYIIKVGFNSERTVGNALIDMYARSGSIDDSCKVFNAIQQKDVVTWSTMIKALAWHGSAKEALDLFQAMKRTGTRPNQITYLALLSACSHAGLADEGRDLFESMEKVYGLQPCVEHLVCMVDIFCRAGHLKDAYNLLESVRQKDYTNAALWGTLLGACRMYGDLVVGEAVARRLFLLEPDNAANYLMLADIYVSAGRREAANSILDMLREQRLGKSAGCSWFDRG